MTSSTNFNSKAVEVTATEKVNGRKNHRWRQRNKKHSGTCPELQSKELKLNKKLNKLNKSFYLEGKD